MNAPVTLSDDVRAAAIARHLFSADVAVAALDPRAEHGRLWDDEHPAIKDAVELRRREFTAGRVAARQAMASLGIDGSAIPRGADRAPIWPEGLVGSISHCATACVAVVARRRDVVSLGIDVEPEAALGDDLLSIICTEEERAWLSAQDPTQRGRLAMLIFSAKECAYKCQFPLTRCIFGFEDLTVRIDLRAAAFEAVFNRDMRDFRAGHRLSGRFSTGAGVTLTGMTMRAGDLPASSEGPEL